MRRFALGLLVAGSCLLPTVSLGQTQLTRVRKLPERYERSPYHEMSLSVGSPTSGWQVRAKRLRSSAALKLKNVERGFNFGHPALVLMLQRSAQQISKQLPGSVLLVGDLSSEPGGPITGHRSHQSGRDVDVGFFVMDKEGKSKRLDRFVAFDGQGRARDGSGLRFDDYRNWLLVQLWLKDHRATISHVFISTPLRARLLAWAKARPAFRKYVDQAAILLKQPQRASAHDDHFHVRIACPERQESLCVERAVVSD